jgi:hypothetical protein
MADSLVFDMLVKTGLKLMAPIRSDRTDPERKLFDYIVYELDCTILVDEYPIFCVTTLFHE